MVLLLNYIFNMNGKCGYVTCSMFYNTRETVREKLKLEDLSYQLFGLLCLPARVQSFSGQNFSHIFPCCFTLFLHHSRQLLLQYSLLPFMSVTHMHQKLVHIQKGKELYCIMTLRFRKSSTQNVLKNILPQGGSLLH